MADGSILGRPTKFTDETKKKIIYAVSKGATFKLACDYARVSYNRFREWMKLGEAQIDSEIKDDFHIFYNDIKEACGKMALECLERIESAGLDGEWTADAWKLERIHAKYYSRDSATIEFNQRLEALEEKKGLTHEEKLIPKNNSGETKS